MNMYGVDYNKDCKEDSKKERKDDFCVQVNIFCDDDKKDSKSKEDDCKKEHEGKEDEFCVQVNIFCDKCKCKKENY